MNFLQTNLLDLHMDKRNNFGPSLLKIAIPKILKLKALFRGPIDLKKWRKWSNKPRPLHVQMAIERVQETIFLGQILISFTK